MASSFSFEMSEKVFASGDGFALRAGFELMILAIGNSCALRLTLDNGDDFVTDLHAR